MRRMLLISACVAAGLTAGFSGVAAAQDPSAEPAVPVPPGQIANAIAALDGVAQEHLRRTGVPGMATAVVHDDRVVYAKGFGLRLAGALGTVNADTVFQLASISKPVGATVIARAVGQGRLRWDDPIVKHLPGFALSDRSATRRVTLADMYAHRSGLPEHSGDLLEDLGFDRNTILRRLRFAPLTPLRAGYAYTNFGLTAAGEAAARALGTRWEDLSERTLYRPLGMRSTSSRWLAFGRRLNRADGHVKVGDRWVAQPFARNPDEQSPAGGVSSSVNDMARWLRMVLAGGVLDGERIIRASALREMLTPVAVAGRPGSVRSRPLLTGLGIDVATDATGRVRYSHSGAFALGTGTNIVWVPDLDLGIVTLTNGEPVGLAESVNVTFLDIVEQGRPQFDWLALYGPRFAALSANPSRLAGRKRPERPRPPRALRAYTGTYDNDFYGPLKVTARRKALAMRLGPRLRQRFRLRHFSGDTFSYQPGGEMAVGISAVTFRRRSVTVEFLDDGRGLGSFSRR
jgi:CubicO group peptidase (beta-lactamase class C family)